MTTIPIEYDEPQIKAWSFSRLEVAERCMYRLLLQHGKNKIKEDNDPKREEALIRGRAIHDEAEGYVRGSVKGLPKSLKKFEKKFKEMRAIFEDDPTRLILEEKWAFNRDWQSVDFFAPDAWLRMILDRGEWLDVDRTTLDITDYKSGKKEGNEVKHGQQGQLFTVGCFMKFPKMEAGRVQFEYVDHGKTSLPKTYSREQAMALLPGFERRGLAITEATVFKPAPNRINCAYCPYGPSRGNGKCIYGVDA